MVLLIKFIHELNEELWKRLELIYVADRPIKLPFSFANMTIKPEHRPFDTNHCSKMTAPHNRRPFPWLILTLPTEKKLDYLTWIRDMVIVWG